VITLSDNDDRFTLLCIQLIWPFRSKVILDNGVYTADQTSDCQIAGLTYGFLGGPGLGGGDMTAGGDLVLLAGENWPCEGV